MQRLNILLWQNINFYNRTVQLQIHDRFMMAGLLPIGRCSEKVFFEFFDIVSWLGQNKTVMFWLTSWHRAKRSSQLLQYKTDNIHFLLESHCWLMTWKTNSLIKHLKHLPSIPSRFRSLKYNIKNFATENISGNKISQHEAQMRSSTVCVDVHFLPFAF